MSQDHMIEAIANIVEAACRRETNIFGYGIWSHHIVYVVKYSKLLAEQLGADSEIVEIAALLHDYASISNPALYDDHHIHGPIEAERVLRSLGYPEERIVAVKMCIAAHRGSVEAARPTAEAVCLASADGMAHIDQVPSLFYLVYVRRQMTIDEGVHWIREKMERSWRKLCPEAQALIHDKYAAAIGLLGEG
jgi:hypothetical protein